MFSSFMSLVTSFVDVLLKAGSKDARRRRLGRLTFKLYDSLSSISRWLDNILLRLDALPDPSPDHASLHSSDSIRILVLDVKPDKVRILRRNAPHAERYRTVEEWTLRQLVIELLLDDITSLIRSLEQFLNLVTKRAALLTGIAVYDDWVECNIRRAIYGDFLIANTFARIAFSISDEGPSIRFNDSGPNALMAFYLFPGWDEAPYNLTDSSDLAKLTELVKRNKSLVDDAKDRVRSFIVSHFSLDEIL